MTITRVGTTEKYASGWESAFGKGKKTSVKVASANKAPAKAVKKAAAKKVSKATKAKTAVKAASKKKTAKKKR